MCNIPFILTLTLFQIQDKVTKNFVFMHTLYKTGGTLCVRLCQTALHICTHLVPINCTIIVDVQHTFHFDHDLILDPGQGHKNFFCMFYLNHNDWQLCHFLHVNLHSHNYIPTILGGGGLRPFWSACFFIFWV